MDHRRVLPTLSATARAPVGRIRLNDHRDRRHPGNGKSTHSGDEGGAYCPFHGSAKDGPAILRGIISIALPVPGSYSSALASTLVPSRPPAMSTFPLVNSVAVWTHLDPIRLPVGTNLPAGVAQTPFPVELVASRLASVPPPPLPHPVALTARKNRESAMSRVVSNTIFPSPNSVPRCPTKSVMAA